jgi:hypothetical protein
MRPYSPFDVPLGRKAPKYPGRWSCIVGDTLHGYKRVNYLIWAPMTIFYFYLVPLAMDANFWVNAGTTQQRISAAGHEFAILWGISLIVGFFSIMLVLGFGRKK